MSTLYGVKAVATDATGLNPPAQPLKANTKPPIHAARAGLNPVVQSLRDIIRPL
jgi:hypothetical protein